jgi:Glycosyl transferase family 11
LKKEKDASVYVSLIGGLGNQLFQLAFALTKSPERKPCLLYGLSHVRKSGDGLPEIFSFAVGELASHYEVKSDKWIERIHNTLVRISVEKKLRLASKVLVTIGPVMLSRVISKRLHADKVKVSVSRGIDFLDPVKHSKDTLHIGYFQSSKCLNDGEVLEKMKSIKTNSKSVALEELRLLSELENPLVVHVRLGDYKQEANIGLLDENYYKRALKLAWKEKEFKKIWVFSDEIELAKSFIPWEYHDFVRWIQDVDNSPALTFEAMRLGHAYVIANSTFSWWAAAISRNSPSEIYCPKPWYSGDNSPEGIIPDNWHTIPRA